MGFIETGSLPDGKVDRVPVPPGEENQFFSAAEWNDGICGALSDLRTQFLSGFLGLDETSSPPADMPGLSSTKLWGRTDGNLMYTRSGVDQPVAAGAVADQGDLLVFTGDNFGIVPLGTTGQVLSVDTTQPTGVKWITIVTAAVTEVDTDGTLTGGPITSTGTLGINLAHANTWTGQQTFADALKFSNNGVGIISQAGTFFAFADDVTGFKAGYSGAFVGINGAGVFLSESNSGSISLSTSTAVTTTTNIGSSSGVANQYTNTTDVVGGGLLAQWTSGTNKTFAIQKLTAGGSGQTWLWGAGTAGALGVNSGLRLSDQSGTILKYSTQSVEVNTDVVGVSFHVGGSNVMSIVAGVVEPATNHGMSLGQSGTEWSTLWAPLVESGTLVVLKSAAATSGTSVAAAVDTASAWSTAGDKLFSIRNNGSEKSYFDFNGNLVLGSATSAVKGGTSVSLMDSTGDGFLATGNLPQIYVNGSAVVQWYSSYYIPLGTMSMGLASYRWNGTFSNYYDSAIGSQLTAASTITPTAGEHHVTGATVINTIAVTNFSGNPAFTIIADSALSWSASGNIAAAGSLSAGLSQTFEYDSGASLWYPQSQGVLLSGANTWTGIQTFNAAPVFAAGLTASGAVSNNFSGSTGAFLTSTGAVTIGGASSTVITGSGKIGPATAQQHTLPAVTSDTFALLAATQTLTNKTITAPTLSGTVAGTFTIGGTGTIGASLAVGTTNTFSIGSTTHLLKSIAVGTGIIGGATNTTGHVVPNIADDTFALLNAAQTMFSKTINQLTVGSYLSMPGVNIFWDGNTDANWQTGLGAAGLGGSGYTRHVVTGNSIDTIFFNGGVTSGVTFGATTGDSMLEIGQGIVYVNTTLEVANAGVVYATFAPTLTTLTQNLVVPKVGPNSTNQHTLPAVTSDTVALLAATQTFTNKTLTSPTLGGTVAGTFSLAGTPTLTSNLTTNAFVGPNYGGTATNVVTPAWTHFTLTNSWTDNLGVNISGYFKDAMGVVHIRCDVGNVSSVATSFATLPAGFRPGQNTSATGWGSSSGQFRSIQISTAGVITPNSADTRFNGFFSFMAEN